MSIQTTHNRNDSMENGTAQTTDLVEAWLEWVRDQDVNDLISEETLEQLINDAAGDEDLLECAEEGFADLWEWAHGELEREDRTVREVLGLELSEKIITFARENDPSEEAARILFRNPAAETMFGNILYDGISEFLQRVDIISTILDQIPLIGGIKGKIEDNFPQGVQGLAEGRIKKFLGNFSGAAAEKAMNFVLSPEHEEELEQVQADLAEYILDQPVKSYVPDPKQSRQWRKAVWSALRNHLSNPEEITPRLQRLYYDHDNRSIKEFLPDRLPSSLREFFADRAADFLDDTDLEGWFVNYYEHRGAV
ncbi:MAG: hypothetical protein ABEK50_02980 [bacterium]